MSSDEWQNLRLVYQEVCQSYHGIASFRARLLGLLPLASGAGIFVLLGNLDGDGSGDLGVFLGPLGVLGFLVTLGLFAYEIRGIQRCNRLIDTGKYLECLLGLPGQFLTRPGSVGGFIGTTLAARVIYPTVLAAWLFLALYPFHRLGVHWRLLVAFLSAVLLFSAFQRLDTGSHRRWDEICEEWGEPAGQPRFD